MTKVIRDLIQLQTNDPAKVVRLESIEGFDDGSGFRCQLTVVSGGYSCRHPFYFDDAVLASALVKLTSMVAGQPNAVVLADRDVDMLPITSQSEFIELRSNDMGHVFVSGEIVEHSELTQSLKFAFKTDQTILGPLLDDLKSLAENVSKP